MMNQDRRAMTTMNGIPPSPSSTKSTTAASSASSTAMTHAASSPADPRRKEFLDQQQWRSPQVAAKNVNCPKAMGLVRDDNEASEDDDDKNYMDDITDIVSPSSFSSLKPPMTPGMDGITTPKNKGGQMATPATSSTTSTSSMMIVTPIVTPIQDTRRTNDSTPKQSEQWRDRSDFPTGTMEERHRRILHCRSNSFSGRVRSFSSPSKCSVSTGAKISAPAGTADMSMVLATPPSDRPSPTPKNRISNFIANMAPVVSSSEIVVSTPLQTVTLKNQPGSPKKKSRCTTTTNSTMMIQPTQNSTPTSTNGVGNVGVGSNNNNNSTGKPTSLLINLIEQAVMNIKSRQRSCDDRNHEDVTLASNHDKDDATSSAKCDRIITTETLLEEASEMQQRSLTAAPLEKDPNVMTSKTKSGISSHVRKSEPLPTAGMQIESSRLAKLWCKKVQDDEDTQDENTGGGDDSTSSDGLVVEDVLVVAVQDILSMQRREAALEQALWYYYNKSCRAASESSVQFDGGALTTSKQVQQQKKQNEAYDELEKKYSALMEKNRKMAGNLRQKKALLANADDFKKKSEESTTRLQLELNHVTAARDEYKNKLCNQKGMMQKWKSQRDDYERKLQRRERVNELEVLLLEEYRTLAKTTGYNKWGKPIRDLENRLDAAMQEYNAAEVASASSSSWTTSYYANSDNFYSGD